MIPCIGYKLDFLVTDWVFWFQTGVKLGPKLVVRFQILFAFMLCQMHH